MQRRFREVCWSPVALAAEHRPLRGVLDVIRWFLLQPGTFVRLNSGRSEFLRAASVIALNALAAAHRVRFDASLVFQHNERAQSRGFPAGRPALLVLRDLHTAFTVT